MKIRFLGLFAVALGALPVFPLVAQDVIVGDPIWALPDPAPDEMPKTKGRLRPEYPEELKKTSELGYVIIHRTIDSTGKSLTINAAGTHEPCKREVQEAFRDWGMSAAKNKGEPIDSRVWLGIIFNPKSAGAKGADATPRLLAVTPVFTSERPGQPGQPPIVRTRFFLDSAGVVTRIQPEGDLKPKVADAITAAAKSWRFAPARKDGQPVESEIVVPVLCQSPITASVVKAFPPRPISRQDPVYPTTMRRYGLTGQVLIEFEVDEAGNVINPIINESDNPAFDLPALKALLAWKFQPGTNDGKPVKTKMKVPIIFSLNRAGESGILQFDQKTDQSKLPPDLRYDTPPKARGVFLPVYPLEAREAGLKGKAAVAMLINPQGRISKVTTISADRPEFGLALTAAVEGFRFDPAYRDGKPVYHLLRFEHEFNHVLLGMDDDDSLMTLEKKHPERIVAGPKLDAQPSPLSRRSPIFPTSVPADITKGEAVIEFLIDKEGRARLPRIVSASDPAFGYAAVQAVGTWLFTPPLSGGKPVVTRVQVPLRFSSPSPSRPAVVRTTPVSDANATPPPRPAPGTPPEKTLP
ncbi:MAG TPA: TonB family protein [Opitutaceae bacterium]|nr:TonB family protein [Opitutaceae bacterium]